MIRKAEPKDLLKIERLIDEYYHMSHFQSCGVYYDRDSVLDTTIRMIVDGFAVISDKDGVIGSVIGGFLYPFPFNRNKIILNEIIWYSKDGSGISILKEFIRHAIKIGVHSVGVSAMFGGREDRVVKILKRFGFKEVDFNCVMQIGGK